MEDSAQRTQMRQVRWSRRWLCIQICGHCNQTSQCSDRLWLSWQVPTFTSGVEAQLAIWVWFCQTHSLNDVEEMVGGVAVHEKMTKVRQVAGESGQRQGLEHRRVSARSVWDGGPCRYC